MLDINFIRENRDAVARAIREKRYKVSLDTLLKLDDDRRADLKIVEDLRQ